MNSKLVSKIISGTLLVSMVGYTLPVFAYTKDETVYSKMDNAGTNYKTVVSDHIKNTEDADTIEDLTDLLNVKNTSGDETYTQDGNKFTWNANKNDIYYQGDTTKELPIDLKVKYELDGNEISAKDIAGKSGKVKITLQYTNKEARTVTVNGKATKMYVPFVVVAGTIIKDENAKNVEVSSGKVVNDGTKTVVVGMAMPGLQESLGLSKNDIDIPSNIEITMDATDFETESIVSYATPKVFEKDDLKIFDKMDSLYADANKLQDSMNQIQDGANQLKEGTTELANGTSQVDSGVKEVATNMSKVTSGAAQLANGQKQVTSGLKQIKGQLPTSKQITENKTQLNTLKAGNTQALTQLNTQLTNTDAQIKGLTAKETEVENNMNLIKSSLNKNGVTFNDSNIDTVIKAYNDNQAKATAAAGQYAAAGDTTKASEYTLKATQAGVVVANLNTYKALLGTKTLINSTITTLTASKTSVTNLQTLISGDEKVVESSLNTLDSMTELNSGVDQLLSGSNKLQTGAQNLQTGSKQLESGVNTLSSATTQLNNGANQVADGTNTLADGITTFNEEGIKKICDVINGDVKDLDERVEKLTDLSKSYNTFTMVDGKNESEVKFIMVVDAVKKQEDSEQSKENAVVENNTITTTNNENENEGE